MEVGGPKVGEVTCDGSPHLSCKRDQIKMTCNLVSPLRCSYLVTLKVGTIHVPIHDERTAITVLSVALTTYQLRRHKALRHAFPGMSLKFK